jgi:hypothetical protein
MTIDRSKMGANFQSNLKNQNDNLDSRKGPAPYIDKEHASRPFWSPGDGDHTIDIIPFQRGPKHPDVVRKLSAVGDWGYVFDFYYHRNIGASGTSVICPQRTFDQPCPICEEIRRLRRMGQQYDSLIKDVVAKRRTIYNIIVYDSPKEEKKGVQFWDISHVYFEKQVVPIAKKPRQGGFVPFMDPVEGQSIFFQKAGQGLQTEYSGVQFTPREVEGESYEISDESLKEAVSPEKFVKVYTYQELKDMISGGLLPKEEPKEDAPESGAGAESDQSEFYDEPRPPRRTAGGGSPRTQSCPVGGDFGDDFDQLQDCDDCSLREACGEKAGVTAETEPDASEEEESRPAPRRKTSAPPPKKKAPAKPVRKGRTGRR